MSTDDGKVYGLKVEHPSLTEPKYWLWPESRDARDDLIGTIYRELKDAVAFGEMITFTVVEDYFKPTDDVGEPTK